MVKLLSCCCGLLSKKNIRIMIEQIRMPTKITDTTTKYTVKNFDDLMIARNY